jgi:anti-sigma-K factor RskA
LTPEEREDLLAAYALGTLSAPDAAAVEQLVRSDSAAASDLAAYHEMVDLIALSAPLRRADPSLRERVLRAARRSSLTGSGRRFWGYSWRPAAAVAAVVVMIGLLTWGINLQRALDRQAENNAAIAAVVEASAKQIQQLASAGVNMQASEDLRQQLQTAVADQELVIAITADPKVQVSDLEATSAGHGASARFLWSAETGAGVLVARSLPDLPLDSVYQVWVDDGTTLVSAGTFLPDERGTAQKVVRPASEIGTPVRVSVSVVPAGGSLSIGTLVVLSGEVNR